VLYAYPFPETVRAERPYVSQRSPHTAQQHFHLSAAVCEQNDTRRSAAS